MKRRVTITEGKVHEVAGVRIDVRRKPRHKRQFVIVIEVREIPETKVDRCLPGHGPTALQNG